jgi:hypothetical protein
MFGRIFTAAFVGAFACCTSQTTAQVFDPRPSLSILVSAFQRCGPPQAYQLLSPYLFSLVAQQTSGQGCYPAIAAAGPITGMQVIDSATFPAGPLYVVRVTHAAGPVDWFIGFDRISSKVIYLTFQSVTNGLGPSITKGADSATNLGLVKPPKRTKNDDTDDDKSDADKKSDPDKTSDPDNTRGKTETAKNDKQSASCKKFPQMCP